MGLCSLSCCTLSCTIWWHVHWLQLTARCCLQSQFSSHHRQAERADSQALATYNFKKKAELCPLFMRLIVSDSFQHQLWINAFIKLQTALSSDIKINRWLWSYSNEELVWQDCVRYCKWFTSYKSLLWGFTLIFLWLAELLILFLLFWRSKFGTSHVCRMNAQFYSTETGWEKLSCQSSAFG